MTLPTFLVIGASRSGTTSLHHYLGQHPEVFLSPRKSPNFFVAGDPLPAGEGPALRAMARQWVSDRAQYEALFAGAGGARAIGDVSPVYLQSIHAPRRIHEACPGARLVAILREPVERAHAHYLGRRRDGLDARPDFRTVVNEELARPLPDDVALGSYLGSSRYHHFLAGYFARFPRAHIRIHLFEDFTANPAAVVADLYDFLGVDRHVVARTERRFNRTGVIRGPLRRFAWTRTVRLRTALRPYLPARVRDLGGLVVGRGLVRPSLDPELRARVQDVLRPDVERLQALIDRDLSAWLGRAGSPAAR